MDHEVTGFERWKCLRSMHPSQSTNSVSMRQPSSASTADIDRFGTAPRREARVGPSAARSDALATLRNHGQAATMITLSIECQEHKEDISLQVHGMGCIYAFVAIIPNSVGRGC